MSKMDGLRKWLIKNGKKVADSGEKAAKDSFEKVKKGASKITEGLSSPEKVGGAVGDALGVSYKAGKKADDFVKKNPKKVALGAGAAGAAAGVGYESMDDEDAEGKKKKKKRPYLED